MNGLRRLLSSFRNDKKDFAFRVVRKTCSGWMPDSLYLRIVYRVLIGKRLHLRNPQSYNEKLQWLKLYDHNPLYTTMVDKYAVKKYVADIIGEEYIIPTLGVWDRPEDIDFSSLPGRFVLKTTFGGGGRDVVICKDKSSLDIAGTIDYLKGFMKQDVYRYLKEWPSKNIPRRIIAEKYMEEHGRPSLTDYKVMCFNGVARLIELHNGRYTDNHTQDFYDRDWNLSGITQGSYGEASKTLAERPSKLGEMIALSETLAKGIPHIRVDWYLIDDQLYFGELTFFDGSGLGPWDKDEDDLLMGSWIQLPEKRK